MIKLYKYQEETVNNAVNMLFERNNSLIVAGTGAGKTIMIAACIGRFFKGFYSQYGKKPHTLVLVHRTEIHGQNHKKFSKVCPDIATSELTAERKSLHGYVHFGMVQTVSGLIKEFDKSNVFFDFIVIDEAHHSKAETYEAIINWNKGKNANTYLLGATATPNRGDKLPLINLFDNYYQITTRFLIDSHYLVRPKFIDLSPIFKVKKESYTIDEKGYLNRNINFDIVGRVLINELITKYLENKEDGKTIIFAPSHEFCSVIYDELMNRGRKPVYLSLGIDLITRESEFQRFEKGDAEELINVDIATEGYDFPPLRNIVEFDTNGTHGQWIQKVGRVLRTFENKNSCTVIDFGGNIDLYPNGIDTGVNLEGVLRKEKGMSLTEADFFNSNNTSNKISYLSKFNETEIFTPYSPPKGFETVNDDKFGIIFVACGKFRDCLVLKFNDEYIAFLGDKIKIKILKLLTFLECITAGNKWIKESEDEFALSQNSQKQIGKMQIKLLAPEYSTMALTWYGANCCICWKSWKNTILEILMEGE